SMRYATDPAERIRYAQIAQRQLQRDAPTIPVLNSTLMLAYAPRLSGVKLQLLIFNSWQWSVSR
ncbi:MAG TPA: hypothetical protein VK587_02520, partial [bacterium]|nr:hypothetical protein [bacterium]